VTRSELEADVAYFDARLSLFHNRPESSYQQAQIKAYRTLGSLLSSRLSNLGGGEPNAPEAGLGRIEVEEILCNEVDAGDDRST
jgi:hypothetical protein